jgi:uncharacterized protein (TIGR03435 family)
MSPDGPPVGRELSHLAGTSIKRVLDDSEYGVQFEMGGRGAPGLVVHHQSLLRVVLWTHNINPCRLSEESPIPPGRYDMVLPGEIEMQDFGHERRGPMQDLVGRALRDAFGLEVQVIERNVRAMVLRLKDGRPPEGLVSAKDGRPWGYNSTERGVAFRRFTMEQLAALTENLTSRSMKRPAIPVVDETGLKGSFDFEVAGHFLLDGHTMGADLERFGFSVQVADRRIPIVVVRQAPAATRPASR